METGNMDRQITLKKRTTTKAASGQPVESLINVDSRAVVWAQVQDDKGSEGYDAEKKTASVTKVVKIHHRTDIDETNVFDYEGRIFDIKRVHELQRRKGLLITGLWTQGQYE